MDYIHHVGTDFIVNLQNNLKTKSDIVLHISHLGDPRNAFLIYFPLAYFFLDAAVGVKVLLMASVAEWLNAILKWLLKGERPYWWVHEEGNWNGDELMQFKLTCETGPGSPSGHSMVTAAVLGIIVQAITEKSVNSRYRKPIVFLTWLSYGCFVFAVSISRLFISAHFPHQVVAGSITGFFVSLVFFNINLKCLKFSKYSLISLVLCASGPMVYWVLESLGMDPLWSVAKATKWCARPEWVYVDTTLFYSLVRDGSAVFGLGLALLLQQKLSNNVNRDSKGVNGNSKGGKTCWSIATLHQMTFMTLGAFISLCATLFIESLKVPSHYPTIPFYLLAFLKHMVIPLAVISVAQPLTTWVCHTLFTTLFGATSGTTKTGKKRS